MSSKAKQSPGEPESIFDVAKKSRLSAMTVLETAKAQEQEKIKSGTHRYDVSSDGKTKILRKI